MSNVYYVTSDSLGSDREIGGRLMQSFWNSFGERLSAPVTVALVNRGVFLALADSPVLEALQDLVGQGCRVLSCGTCLDFYQARDRLTVGEVGSMALLQELFVTADKVVTL